MQLIHLTDLHYQHEEPFQKALIKALLLDLTKRLADGWSPDALIFSGDLARNPDDPNILERFEEFVLRPVLATTRLSEKDVIFCPGNHDVSQKVIREWSDERQKVKDALDGNQDDLNAYLKTGPAQAYVKSISAGFFELASKYGHAWTNPFTHTYAFPKHKVCFVALSTAFGCGLEGSKHDRGKLALPADQTLTAFQGVPSENRTISLMHHTLSDLSEASSRLIVPIIEHNAEAHFYGHVHLAKPSAVTGPGSECFLIQGGALYEGRGNYNCYSLVDLGPGPARTAAHYRTYYPDRAEFDTGINIAEKGVFYNSVASKTFWETHVPPATNDDICMWLMETQAAATRELDKTITPRPLSDTFVDPVITRSTNDGSGGNTQVTPSQIVNSANHIVIACEAEYGATSLLNYLTLQFHAECLTLPQALVPCLIDARNIKGAYPAAVETTIRNGLPDSTSAQLKLQPLHDHGRLVVLVDNLDPANKGQQNYLNALRTTYPKARLIVAVKMPFVDTQRLRPIIGIDEFEFMQLRTLTRSKVRKLVEKWKLPNRYETNTVVEEINSKFSALGIPQTAVYVVIYLSILEEIESFNPINSSTVIEQFVESALQKYKPVYAFRSVFDYRNQIDYLGAVAERMCRDNLFIVDYEKLYQWTKEYFEHIGQEHDITKLVSYFVENKVFSHEGNEVYFRYNIFLSFFIAHRMLQSEQFRQWLLEEHRFTSYITEIDIYCGLSRGDAEMIEFFKNEFEKTTKTLEDYIRPLLWTDRLEKLTLPVVKKSETEAFAEGITRQLTSDMPPEKRDEVVSGGREADTVKPDLKRTEAVDILPLWILTLRAYTVSLKNLENLPKEDKERHLKKILEGWSAVVRYACIVFNEVVEKRSIEVGPMKFAVDMPAEVDARVMRLIFVHIPAFVSDWLRRDLGSQKLALQLRNDAVPTGLTEAFLQTSLYADLKLDEYLGRITKLKKQVTDAGSQAFMEFMLIKLRDIFLRLGLQHDEESGFLNIAAELSADIKGLSGDERTKEIERYTTYLRRSGQVKQLKESY